MLKRAAQQQVRAGLEQLAKAQDQVSSGRRVILPSDDPLAAARILRLDHSLRGSAQYSRNATAVRTRLDAEDAAFSQVSELLGRAQEIAIQQGGDSASSATRTNARAEVDGLINQLVSLGNTTVGSEFIFGGTLSTTPPFQANGTYIGDTADRVTDLGRDSTVTANHNGNAAFVSSGVMGSLTSLRDALATGSGPAVAAALPALRSAFDNLQALLAETGARSLQVDAVEQELTAAVVRLRIDRAQSAEVPYEEAVTEFLASQQALQASLSATSRILELNITDYLR
jgi:flagellar hook-associated protein 3 FlgL